jgi:signal transduction histidine kinase
MRRGAKPSKARVESKLPVAPKSRKNEGSRVRDLEKRLAEALKREAEALEQQTATAEILRVISSSPADLEPVFRTLLVNAARLCGAHNGGIFRVERGALHLAASYNISPELRAHLESAPIQPGPGGALRRAGLELQPVQSPDASADTDLPIAALEAYRREGMRTAIAVPLLKENTLIGAIAFHRREVRPFSDKQIALLKTFADQAVIAIENVRLFTELQEKNRALTQAHAQVTETLEQQTATSEILRVIASTPTDLTPVFETILRSAVRLFNAHGGSIRRFDGELVHLAAVTSPNPEADDRLRRMFPHPPDREYATERPILDGTVAHIPDTEDESSELTQRLARDFGFRRLLGVPMLREGQIVGVINVTGLEPGPYSARQIALLQTFADQAVIAVENVRLFKELEARNRDLTETLEQQTATSEILRVISSSPTDVEPVFRTILANANTLCDASFSVLWLWDGEALTAVAHENVSQALAENLRTARPRPNRRNPLALSILEQAVVHVADVLSDPRFAPEDVPTYRLEGARSIMSVPMLREGSLVGVINTWRREPRAFTDGQIELLKTFADQAVIAVENVRLFTELQTRNLEIADKSRQLEVASQHKSEFLANMSHELRTPLNAIIGFSEVLTERMFGDLNEKQEEYLKDIHASGTHLLSLINDILDLSKIEAGRMELELTDFDLPTAIDNALTLVRERAGRRSITLEAAVDQQLGEVRADERKIRQVVLNLLSNAIKFTLEGGRIDVRAVPVDGSVEVSVSDTGVGIAPEDQEAVFEEFRQVGTSAAKQEGTGLGLTLCRKFIELHGGRIWVKSQVGAGSTFTFTIPLRRGE